MKKSYVIWTIASAAVMLLLPWAAVNTVNGDAGMAVSLLLLFAVDPIYSAAVGYAAGKDIKALWGLPVITALMFLLGARLVIEMGADAFALYSAGYLVIGAAVMLVSAFLRKRSAQ